MGGELVAGLDPLGPSSPKQQRRWLCATLFFKIEELQSDRKRTPIEWPTPHLISLSKMHSDKKKRSSLLSKFDAASNLPVKNAF